MTTKQNRGAHALGAYKHDHKLTVDELAKRLGLGYSTVQGLLNGRTKPGRVVTQEKCHRIAGVEPRWWDEPYVVPEVAP